MFDKLVEEEEFCECCGAKVSVDDEAYWLTGYCGWCLNIKPYQGSV